MLFSRCGKLCVNPVVLQVEMCVRMVFPKTLKTCTMIGHCKEAYFPFGAPEDADYTNVRSQGVDTKSQPLRQRLSAGRYHFQLRSKEEGIGLRGCLARVPSGAVKGRRSEKQTGINLVPEKSSLRIAGSVSGGFWSGGSAWSFWVIPGGYGRVAQVRNGEEALAGM